jgi:hypothetical protein
VILFIIIAKRENKKTKIGRDESTNVREDCSVALDAPFNPPVLRMQACSGESNGSSANSAFQRPVRQTGYMLRKEQQKYARLACFWTRRAFGTLARRLAGQSGRAYRQIEVLLKVFWVLSQTNEQRSNVVRSTAYRVLVYQIVEIVRSLLRFCT